MQALRLTLRGLRWRSGASLAVLLVAVLASKGAACGPLYSRSAQESLVRDGPGQIAPITTGVIFRGNVDGQTQFSPRQVLDAVSTQASAPTLDPWYRAGTLSLTVLDGNPRIGAHTPGRTQVSWYRGECGAITVTAMISGRLADATQVKLGTIMALGITSNPAADRVQLVGVYDQSTASPAVRGLATPINSRSPGPMGHRTLSTRSSWIGPRCWAQMLTSPPSACEPSTPRASTSPTCQR